MRETTTKRGLTAAAELAYAAEVAYAPLDGSRYLLSVPQRVIQISRGWSDEYQHRFCICNHHLGASRPGGLLFFGDPEAVTLSQFAFRPNERFSYEYNFFDAWLLDIRFESEHALDPKRHYPGCVVGARRGPPEDSGGAEIFMDRQVPGMWGSWPTRRSDLIFDCRIDC